MKKRAASVGLTVAALLGLLVTAYGLYRSHRRPQETVLPEFVDAPPGPSAPRAALQAFGALVGTSKFAEIESLAQKKGWTCRDTSIRALMAAKRAAMPDAVSNASAKKKSPKERNPQIRYSCEQTIAQTIQDRPRSASKGRLLFIFDSPEHPLRHVSFRRSTSDHAAARLEALSAVQDLEGRLRKTASTQGSMPAKGQEFALAKPVHYRWRYANLAAQVSVTNLGRRG